MKIKIDSILIQKYSNRKPIEIPDEIQLNKEISWMIGFWIGDNCSSREGTTLKNNIRSSGRFGIINNDIENINRFKRGLEKELKTRNIKIDVQIPTNEELNKEPNKRKTSRIFGLKENNINVYSGSPWRKNIGYTVYTNNTVLLRIITNEIYKKLLELVNNLGIDINALLQGIFDSEGTVDKANKILFVTNKDNFVINIITESLNKIGIKYNKSIDNRARMYIKTKSLQMFKEKIGFHTIRKQKELTDMLSGNYSRERDKEYLKIFYDELRNGVTAKNISKKFNIPLPTVKLVLRNLFSGKHIQRRKESRHYVYYVS